MLGTVLLAAGLLAPLGLLRLYPAWAKGLWLGQAVGLLTAGWIRWTVHRAFSPAGVQRRFLGWHTLARMMLVAAVLLLALKSPSLRLWAVVMGYSWMLWVAAIGQAYPMGQRQRGVQ